MYLMRSRFVFTILVFCVACSLGAQSQPTQNYLANNTVLIVRHAEKPESGTGLTPVGEARAQLYAKYFEPFEEQGLSIPVDCLYAGAEQRSPATNA